LIEMSYYHLPASDFELYLCTDGTLDDRLPIEGEIHDCFVINRLKNSEMERVAELGKTLASQMDWIEVFGSNAEAIHDAIDNASVVAGVQEQVGAGSPMTAWYDDMQSDQEIAEYIRTGGQGYRTGKLVVLLGSDADLQSLKSAIESALRAEQRTPTAKEPVK